MSADEEVARHRRAGATFDADGVGSFVRRGRPPSPRPDAKPVVLMHGVPSSSYLYRKVIAALEGHGLEGVAFDLPGLGLAERPERFDYTWTGLGRFSTAAIDALGIDDFHLVVHDIGGPVGFEVATALRARVRSLTLLNTVVLVDEFEKPWSMRPFERPLLGRLWLASTVRPVFRQLMYLQGIAEPDRVRPDELDAYHLLLHRTDGGAAFLKIMQSFETTRAKRERYVAAIRGTPYPVQIVWARDDPALSIQVYGEQARRASGLEEIHALPGKHFFQEDQPEAIARHVAALVSRADGN